MILKILKILNIMQMDQYELSATTTNWSVDSNRIRYALLSMFGKLDYNYLNRYYLSASFRRDGSSRFSKDNRWGNFYSIGGSWRLSKEAFMFTTATSNATALGRNTTICLHLMSSANAVLTSISIPKQTFILKQAYKRKPPRKIQSA